MPLSSRDVTTRPRALTALLFATIALVPAACSAGDDTGQAPPSSSGAPSETNGTGPTEPEPTESAQSPAVFSMPSVSCEALEPLLDPLLEGLRLDDESTVSDSEFLSCGWVPVEERLDDIRTATVSISVGDPEVPDVEAAADYGLDYSTDPRLDQHGGVMLWTAAGGETIMGGGVGSVYVPGLEIMASSGGFAKETGFDQEFMVQLALGILELPGVQG